MATKLLKTLEVAALCGVAPRTVARWRDMGFMPLPLKLCKTVRWRESDISEWVTTGCPDCRKTGWQPLASAATATTTKRGY